MTLWKFYTLIRDTAVPLYYSLHYSTKKDYKVVCNDETVTGIRVDHDKKQVILKTYKRKDSQ